jgi:hypothetical protein
MAKRNPFSKEYYTGRKDQFDLDYMIFRKVKESATTLEELIAHLEERFQFVIAKIAEENARELLEGMEVQ